MLKLGAMFHAVTEMGNDRRPFHEGVRMVRDAGYDAISFLSVPGAPVLQEASDQPDRSLIDIVASNPRAVLQVVEDNGLEMHHLHAGGYLVKDEKTAQRSVENMKPVVDAALRLGIRYVSSGLSHNFAGWSDKRPYLERLSEVLNRVAGYIGDADLRIGVDVHCYSVVETVEEARHLLAGTDETKTGLCLNMGHLTTAQQPGWRLVEAYPERIVVAAWKDHIVTPGSKKIHSVRLGRGVTPFHKYKAAFEKVTSDAFHVHSFEGEPYEEKGVALAESYRYWRHMWDAS